MSIKCEKVSRVTLTLDDGGIIDLMALLSIAMFADDRHSSIHSWVELGDYVEGQEAMTEESERLHDLADDLHSQLRD